MKKKSVKNADSLVPKQAAKGERKRAEPRVKAAKPSVRKKY